MAYRYYTTQRPPMVGCIPRGGSHVVFLDEKPLIKEIGRQAWGYAEYDRKLTDEEIADYELVEGNTDD